jgi:nucleoside-diphosphate-sugar epimerase
MNSSTPPHRACALVTGAGGFVAGCLGVALLDAGCIVRRHRRSDGDVGCPETWRAALDGVDVVFHLAAETSAREAEQDPEADQRTNVDAVMHLVQQARRLQRPPTVVFASTDTIAGVLDGVVHDGISDQPRTIYDLHKLHAEKVLEWGTRRGFVRGVTLRLSTIYGPGGQASNTDRGVVNAMVRRALRGEPLTVYGDGSCRRDLIHIDDAVTALCTAAVQVAAVEGDHFVVGSGCSPTLAEIFRLIAEAAAAVTGRCVAVEQVPWPPTIFDIDRRSVRLDPGRFRERTGWLPRRDFRTAVFDTARRLAEEET